MIVGEIVAHCAPQFLQFINVRVASEDTPFVQLVDESCKDEAGGNRYRFKVVLDPRVGDAGKYKPVISAEACGSRPSIFMFKITVKKSR